MNTQIPAEGTYLKLKPIGEIPFRPFYDPKTLLNFGIKGGTFGNDNLEILYQLPKPLVDTFKSTNKWGQANFNSSRNHFNVVLYQSERDFTQNTPYKSLHPLGWFEWYCKFYYGEKSPADMMRLFQWFMGINTAWYYIQKGAADLGQPAKLTDLTYLPIRRQALLEWGVDPTLDPITYGCGDAF